MENTKIENAIITKAEAMELALSEKPKATVTALAKEIATISTEQSIAKIGELAERDRCAWVYTALCVGNAFKNLSKRECAKRIAELQDKLKYSRAQVYNYRKAGEKLVSTDYEALPYDMAAFIREKKEKPVNNTIASITQKGSYRTGDNSENYIYIGNVTNTAGKAQVKYFVTTKKDGEKLNRVCDNEEFFLALTPKKVEDKEVDFWDTADGKLSIEVNFVNL